MNPTRGDVSTREERVRTVEQEMEIDAPLSAVWKALTEAKELVRWFPTETRVNPGLGGSIWLRWEDEYEAESGIEIWEPERHLRLMFPIHGSTEFATDYFLQSRTSGGRVGGGGGTVLRVVTSGFGVGDDWDVQFEDVRSGWAFELCGLRHYLERHRGKDRVVARARAAYTCDSGEAWARLTGPGGWLGPEGLDGLAVGESYVARTTAATLAGIVQVWDSPRQFVATVDGWNDALLRVELYASAAVIWLSTYGVPAGDVQSLERAWQTSIDELFATKS